MIVMTFKEALSVVQSSERLIGTKFDGETIDEILVVPTEKSMHDEFFRNYSYTLDAKASILPFVNCDLEVVALFRKNYIRQEGVIITTNVARIIESIQN